MIDCFYLCIYVRRRSCFPRATRPPRALRAWPCRAKSTLQWWWWWWDDGGVMAWHGVKEGHVHREKDGETVELKDG